jgi:glycyl-tRNA synthetase
MPAQNLDSLVSLCKRRGYVFPGSEIYGGLANTWDYGPLGVELKNNIKHLWWKTFVHKRTDMVGLDAAILMNPRTWEASGHVGSFSDPLIDCKKCKSRYRADKLIEENTGNEFQIIKNSFINFSIKFEAAAHAAKTFKFEAVEAKSAVGQETITAAVNMLLLLGLENEEELSGFFEKIEFLAKEIARRVHEKTRIDDNIITSALLKIIKLPCPICKSTEWSEPRQFNLMFKTQQGVIEGEGTDIYLRPETAQGIFVNFKNVATTTRMRLPFGVAQIGKAFRNEITPGNFTFRTREFEQMEIEYFFDPSVTPWEGIFTEWKKDTWAFLTETLGIKAENLRFRDHEKDELSHYSKGTTDVEYKFPWGWGELCAAAAYRTDFDLTQHQTFSGEDMQYTDPDEPTRKIIPHVMEPSFGADRIALAVMLDAYDEEKLAEDDTRTVMHLSRNVAPMKIAILPLSKKEHLIAKAKEIRSMLVDELDVNIDFDITGSIGKRYRRQDEIGTPKCVTVDFGTLGEDPAQGATDTVTIRDRDTQEQVRVPLSELAATLRA